MARRSAETGTVLYREMSEKTGKRLTLILFDGQQRPQTIDLDALGKSTLTMGRESQSGSNMPDICVNARIVSRSHAVFEKSHNGWVVRDADSTNGLLLNGRQIQSAVLGDGDILRISDRRSKSPDGVLILCSARTRTNWVSMPLEKRHISIGRKPDNEICIPHVSVSGHHASIVPVHDGYEIVDQHSTNGVFVNGERINERCRLKEKDVITITTTRMVYVNGVLYYTSVVDGISVEADDVVIVRGHGKRAFTTSNHVSLRVDPGELISIIGGSGAGKTTILNALCGYLEPTSGSVRINGMDLYENFDAIKRLIGYVPQSDIVYNDLSLHDTLRYTAILRLPKDTTEAEYEAAIDRAIAMVELTDKKDSLIKNLSGGQRKRASIAVELLSDPKLLFLDEPASGLDPGTERSLMHTLRKMADQGKTIILVTHSTLQLQLCDKVAFMGRGGRLCCFDSLTNALHFFGIRNVVDVYDILNNSSAEWQKRFQEQYRNAYTRLEPKKTEKNKKPRSEFHLGVLCSRYARLIWNDKARLLLILAQAPLLVLLIAMVSSGEQFKEFEITQNLLFSLACCGFWVGMLNAIQEVCKERTIARREYMTGMSLTSYILSKFLVLSVACILQSAMIVSTFALLIGLPEEGVIMHPWMEFFITTLLLEMSATALGLAVSTVVDNPDRATTLAPILLMPQLLFSGLIFELKGLTETVSWATICRWSMEGYGTTSNLNAMPLRLQLSGVPVEHIASDFFKFTPDHMWKVWGIMLAFTVVCLMAARLGAMRIKHHD